MEPLHKTILRHIKERDINLTTLKKGFAAVRDRVDAFHESHAELKDSNEEANYRGISGLDVTHYDLITPPLNPRYRWDKSEWGEARFEFVAFPSDSHLNIYVVDEKSFSEAADTTIDPYTTDAFIRQVPNAIASFTGPTFTYPDLPNNGFFHRADETAATKFEDTNPSGQRRGAFGITSDKRLVLMDDQEKWSVVRSNFSGFDTLVGTSNYFTDEDTPETLRKLTDNSRGKVSFLIKYVAQDDTERLVFAVSIKPTTTVAIKNLMDYHLVKLGAQRYFALELELNNANCVTKNAEGIVERINEGGFFRRDHYVIERPNVDTEKEPATDF
jgi:hypothetical protein